MGRARYKRMLVSEYRKVGFAGKPPCAQTIRSAITNGDIPGEKFGGQYVVFVDDDYELVWPGREQESMDPVVKKILEEYSEARA